MANNASIICDTNVLAFFLDGDIEAGRIFEKNDVMFSSITYIEILSNKKLTSARRELLRNFLDAFTVIETSQIINSFSINMRLNYNLDTPDAIIATTVKYLNVPLITADSSFFKMKDINVVKFEK